MTTDDSSPPETPTTIESLASGAMSAFAMLAGMQLDLFSPLKDGPLSAEQISKALGVQPGKLRLLLYALVNVGLLSVDGELFSNTPESDRFLVSDRPTYIGGWHRGFEGRWLNAMSTAESIRTGTAQAKMDFANMSEEDLESFLLGLHPRAVETGRKLHESYDLSAHRRMVEVGAGLGGVTLGIAGVCPDIEAVIVDFPAVTSIAARVIAEAGFANRVSVLSGNAVTDSLGGPFDLAVMRAFIQVLSPDQAQQALNNVNGALEPGGVIYVVGQVLDDSRVSPLNAVLFNLTFLNVYDGGQSYTESEYRSWLVNAGFEDIEVDIGQGGDSVIRAQKKP